MCVLLLLRGRTEKKRERGEKKGMMTDKRQTNVFYLRGKIHVTMSSLRIPRGSSVRSQRLAAYAAIVWKERCVTSDGFVRECAKQP